MAIVAANKMPCQFLMLFLVVGMVSIHCYPINNEGRRSTTDSNCPVIMSNTVRDLLVDVNNTTNKGLLEVYFSADYLVNYELYTPEVR